METGVEKRTMGIYGVDAVRSDGTDNHHEIWRRRPDPNERGRARRARTARARALERAAPRQRGSAAALPSARPALRRHSPPYCVVPRAARPRATARDCARPHDRAACVARARNLALDRPLSRRRRGGGGVLSRGLHPVSGVRRGADARHRHPLHDRPDARLGRRVGGARAAQVRDRHEPKRGGAAATRYLRLVVCSVARSS